MPHRADAVSRKGASRLERWAIDVIIVPPASGRTINVRISIAGLVLAAAAVVGLTASLSIHTHRLTEAARDVAVVTKERDTLKTEAVQQARELDQWRSQVQSLNTRIQQFESEEKGLHDLETRVQGLLGGAGGPDGAGAGADPVPPDQSVSPADLSHRLAALESDREQTSASLSTAAADLAQYIARQAAIPKGWPAAGSITDGYGWRIDPLGRGRLFHEGVDIGGSYGSEVSARADGVVVFAGWKDGGYGLAVVIDHGNGLETLYAHSSAVLVHEGQAVRRGDVIARMGSTGQSTGPHVHYEVHQGGQPVDPMPYLN